MQVVASVTVGTLSINGLAGESQRSSELTGKNWRGEEIKKCRDICAGRWSRQEGLSRFPHDPRSNTAEVEMASALLQAELEALTIPLPVGNQTIPALRVGASL